MHLLECGLLAGSFIPPADLKAARDVVHYRTKIVQQRTSEIARLGNVLQDALLTELPDISAAQEAWASLRPIVELSQRSHCQAAAAMTRA